MTKDEMVEVLGRHAAFEHELDLDGTMQTQIEDCFQAHASIGLRCRGQVDCRRYYEEGLMRPFPTRRLEQHGVVLGDDVLVKWGVLQADMVGPWMGIPSTGRSFLIEVVVLVRFAENLVAGEVLHYDSATICEQLGLDRREVLEAAHALSSHP